MKNNIEEKKNELKLELRNLLSVIDMIDGLKGEYKNYEENSLDEEKYLDEQILLAVEARTRLTDIIRK